MQALPIDPLIIQKRGAIPRLLAELSYKDEKKALEFLQVWGEKKMAITLLFDAIDSELRKEEIK